MNDSRVVVHYPKDGVTHMKGECGAHSVSSCRDLHLVTCIQCHKILKENRLKP